MDVFISALTSLNNFVWGPVMLVLLVGTGLYLNVILRFFSFRNWIHAYKLLWQGREHQSQKGEISPWNALMTALPVISAPATSWVWPRLSPSAARAPSSGCG